MNGAALIRDVMTDNHSCQIRRYDVHFFAATACDGSVRSGNSGGINADRADRMCRVAAFGKRRHSNAVGAALNLGACNAKGREGTRRGREGNADLTLFSLGDQQKGCLTSGILASRSESVKQIGQDLFGSPPSVLSLAEETFGQPFRRG